MSQFGDQTNIALVKRLAGGLNLVQRLIILSVALNDAIATSREDYACELVHVIPQVISPDGQPKHAGDSQYFAEVAKSDRAFCLLLMEAYPKGSIRGKTSRSSGEPSLMGIRGDILKQLSLRWGQNFDDFGKAIFRFLLESLAPGTDEVELLPPEREMVLGIVRERLKHAGDFSECVLRAWLTELEPDDFPWRSWEDEFVQLLAIARVRNDSIQNVFIDVMLRNNSEKKGKVSA